MAIWGPPNHFDVGLQKTTKWPLNHFVFTWRFSGHQVVSTFDYEGQLGGH
jgi:hypothetical protein